jgi:ketosteroid isomerase-like protein
MVRMRYGTIVGCTVGCAALALVAGLVQGQPPSRAPSVDTASGDVSMSPSVDASGKTAPTLRRVLGDLLPAANAHDTDRFLASYLHDSSLVMIFNGHVTAGYDSVRAQQLRAWTNSDVVYSQRAPMHITWLSHDLAVVTDRLRSTRTLPSGETRRSDFTVTMVCERRPDGWRIVHVRESTVS